MRHQQRRALYTSAQMLFVSYHQIIIILSRCHWGNVVDVWAIIYIYDAKTTTPPPRHYETPLCQALFVHVSFIVLWYATNHRP